MFDEEKTKLQVQCSKIIVLKNPIQFFIYSSFLEDITVTLS